MGKPNTKLDPDMSIYEDERILREVCRKGSKYLDTVNCKALWEIRGPHVKARWICTTFVGSGHHNDWWDSPAGVIKAELAGESGCPICRQLAQEDVVTKAELLAGIKEQDARMKKSADKSARFTRRSADSVSASDRYYMVK